MIDDKARNRPHDMTMIENCFATFTLKLKIFSRIYVKPPRADELKHLPIYKVGLAANTDCDIEARIPIVRKGIE
jgi:hypothetical protein